MLLSISSLMTLWVTYIILGNEPEFSKLWGHSFLLARLAAGVILFINSPLVQCIALRVLG
ncbi:DUF2798 domain-containing protein [Candidatus Njordibacter sp. Uisw_056]|uniref:DUF2798 domain-containing protein n=1 Tax=Candidatus Njordibacter sp. Uisw_056 TaxID=3230973 RepID=UPI003D40E827